jgi:hypothetical protein
VTHGARTGAGQPHQERQARPELSTGDAILSRWAIVAHPLTESIKVNSVPVPSSAPLRDAFHAEMGVPALGIESRLVTGTMRAILLCLTDTLIEQPLRTGR